MHKNTTSTTWLKSKSVPATASSTSSASKRGDRASTHSQINSPFTQLDSMPRDNDREGEFQYVAGPITEWHRSLVVELLITITHQCGHQSDTLHLAVNLLDRYLSKKKHTRATQNHTKSGLPLTLPTSSSTDSEWQTQTPALLVQMQRERETTESLCSPKDEDEEAVVLSSQLCGIAMSSLTIAQKFEQGTRLSFSDQLPLVRNWERILRGQCEVGDLEWPNCSASTTDGTNRVMRGTRLDTLDASYVQTKASNAAQLSSKLIPDVFQVYSDLDLFGKKALVQVEHQILQGLKWQVKVPTINTFLRRYAIVGQLNRNMMQVASCTCDRALLEYRLLKYPPSLVAASIISLVRLLW